jgi:glycosyltransferase involved in cell wall biosynthesis
VTDAPTFSVIFPTYNRCDVVERTVRHLLAQEYPNDRYEIIAVDNSTDGTPEMIERLAAESERQNGPCVRLLRSEDRLPAVKRNRGLEIASGEYAFFVNDDMWFEPDAMTHHARQHQAWDEPIAVLGSCRQSPEMAQTPFIEFYEPFMYDRMARFAGAPVPYEFFWSMNLSLPRRVMIERNLVFHEDWTHIGHEDIELGWRWTRAGLRAVYTPEAYADHYHPHTVESACRVQESIGRGLRDLEALVDDPGLLERYGVLTTKSSMRGICRGVARELLFNRYIAPRWIRWLDGRSRNTVLTRAMYWKVLIHSANAGYRDEPRRTPAPLIARTSRATALGAAT